MLPKLMKLCAITGRRTAAAYINLIFMSVNIAGMEAGNILSRKSANIGVCCIMLVCIVMLLPVTSKNKRLSMDTASQAGQLDKA